MGRRVADRWRAAGHEVFAVTRSPTRAAEFAHAGLQPIVADCLRLETLADLPAADTVLYSVGYDREQAHGIEEVYLHGLVNVLGALPEATGRVIHTSSTGVYGDCAGDWVDEQTPCFPDRPGGRACLAAEEALRAHPRGANAVILRLAGIYGPGRVPRAETLASGRPIPAAPKAWLNLIHVDDAATVILAAETIAGPRVFVVSDGNPVSRREYYRELARLMGLVEPRFIEPAPASRLARRAAGDKRASNARLVDELGIRFAHPSYREGLASILASG
ncbi:MAG: SDR family oxidoreductase [Planctomycetia bacterium]|nr:SDR family oxidoreductase [Planctomycetia bacterium]